MKSDMDIKMALLDQLEELLLGRDGEEFLPKGEVSAIMVAEPAEGEEAEEAMDEAEDAELEELAAKELAEPEDDEDNEPRRKGLREFMRNC